MIMPVGTAIVLSLGDMSHSPRQQSPGGRLATAIVGRIGFLRPAPMSVKPSSPSINTAFGNQAGPDASANRAGWRGCGYCGENFFRQPVVARGNFVRSPTLPSGTATGVKHATQQTSNGRVCGR